jgi:flagellar motor switch protein FliN/FliY
MPRSLEAIKTLEVPIIVRLAQCKLSMKRISTLTPGEIIDLGISLETDASSGGSGPLDILVNNQKIAQGQAVKVGENYGVKVGQLDDLDTRITALGTG